MDKYTKAIEYLATHPEELRDAFYDPYRSQGGCLFAHSTKGAGCGCLVQIRQGLKGISGRLDDAIRQDPGIPESAEELLLGWARLATEEARKEFLAPFAGWQRKMDKEAAPLGLTRPATLV